jgi:hypothetical protein
VAVAVHLGGSATVVFTATEHLVSASGTAAIASEIGGIAFALTHLHSIHLLWLDKLVRM